MSELVLNNRKLKVTIDDKPYELRKFKVRDQELIQSKLVDYKENDPETLKVMVDLVCDCGLPKDVVEDLDTEQFLELVTFMGGDKKKS